MSFWSLAPREDFYFFTIKSLKSARECKELVTYLKNEIKRYKRRYNAKKHYIFAIANHDRAGFHIHFVTNCNLEIPIIAHVDIVRDLKAACLYLVKNLEWSRFEDYGGERRYGGSSLLNKQNKKQAFKNRLRLWRIRTRKAIAKWVIVALVTIAYSAIVKESLRCSMRCVPMQIKPAISEHRKPVERPPPRHTEKAIKKNFTFAFTSKSEGG